MVLRQDGNGGYVLDGLGGLHPFNGAPALAGPRPWPGDSARTLLLSFDGQSGYVGDSDGNVVPFGRAPTVQVAAFGGGSAGGSALANDGVSGVIVSTPGVRRTFRSAHVARTLLPRDATSGYVLFGDGSLKAFGGAPAATGTPSWPTFDIARGAVLLPDGVSGYILDGYGPLHPFSGAAAAPSGGPSWPGVDIGRDVSAALDGGALYVLDGFGGVHTLGSAPKLTAASYFGGNDVARKLAIRADATGGYYLTATGSLVAIGAAPAVTGTPAWGGDIARGLWLNSDGVSGYILDGFGGVHRFGGAGRLAGPVDGYARGWDVFRDFKFTSATTAASLDVYGQRHTYILDADAGTTEPPSPDDDAGLPGDDGGSIEPGSDGGDGRLEDGGFLDDGGSDPGLAPGPPPRLTPVGGGCGCGSLPSSAAAWLATFTLACRRRRPREATPTPPDTNRT